MLVLNVKPSSIQFSSVTNLLLIEHLLSAGTVQDTRNAAMNTADEAHVFMGLTLGMTKTNLGMVSTTKT